MNRLHPLPNDPARLVQLESLQQRWELSHFERPRLPLEVATIGDQATFSAPNRLDVQDLPIKMPRTDYRLPPELSQFSEALSSVIAFEERHNSRTDDLYAYLTIKQDQVSVGETQRRRGAHADGFPLDLGMRMALMDHTYVAFDTISTEFFDQPFPIGHVKDYREALEIFDRLADERRVVTVPPFVVVLMDSCTVHRAAKAHADVHRTFFRVSYSLSRFNRAGNTHNPLFDYDWELIPRGTGRTPSSTEY